MNQYFDKISNDIVDDLKSIPSLPSASRTVAYSKCEELIFSLTSSFPEHIKRDERLYCILNGYNEIPTCPVCGNNKKFHKLSTGYPSETCSAKCGQAIQKIKTKDGVSVKELAVKKRLDTIKDRYGAGAFSDFARKRESDMKTTIMEDGRTALEHREEKRLKTASIVGEDGFTTYQRVAHNNHKKEGFTESNIQKRLQTMANDIVDGKNGFDRVGEKSKQTLDTVGEDGLTRRQKATRKMVETLITKEVDDKLNDAEYLSTKTTFEISQELGVAQSTIVKRRAKLGVDAPYSPKSSLEVIIRSIVDKYYSGEIVTNTKRIISPKELDIYIPEFDIAFEVNGIYHHSFLHGNKSRNYHLHKMEECNKLGIRLVHIFENEIESKFDIVESRIRNFLGKSETIYARKCKIVEISSTESIAFLDKNHIQGGVGSSVRYGLVHNDELVAVMTFGKPRYSKCEWELIRYASKCGTSVVGGGSRLFKHFLKEYSPLDIVSYCDLRWGTGNMYEKLGFEYSHRSRPNYFYFKVGTTQLESRMKFQKYKQSESLGVYDSSLTEWENMVNDGYDKIFDCGNNVYIYRR